MKKFEKQVENQQRPGFRTASRFIGNKFSKPTNLNIKFSPGIFKTQHKG